MTKTTLESIQLDLCKPFTLRKGDYKVTFINGEEAYITTTKDYIIDSVLGKLSKPETSSLIYLYLDNLIKLNSQ